MAADVLTFPLYDTDDSLLDTFLLPKNKLDATTDPGLSNDNTEGYAPGSIWANRTGDKVFVCADNDTSSAVWKEVTGSAGATSGSSLSYADNTGGGILIPTGSLTTATISLIDTGDGDISGLANGDVVRAKWWGDVSIAAASTFRFRLKANGNDIGTSCIFTSPGLTEQGWVIELSMMVTDIDLDGGSIQVWPSISFTIGTADGTSPLVNLKSSGAGYGFGYSGVLNVSLDGEFVAGIGDDEINCYHFTVEKLSP